MATAATTPMRPRREMQEISAPEQFTFSDQHRNVNGVLIDISLVTVKDKNDENKVKEAMQYTMRQENGRRITFLGTYDLTRKIEGAHVGHYMEITYEGEDKSVQTQGSPLRKFKVKVAKEKEEGAA